MANKNKPITFAVQSGGQLNSRRSHEQAGFANYVVKRDFRRDLDAEIRAEGSVYFQTNFETLGDQPYPQRQGGSETFLPITLLHQARRPNGQTATIAGTYATLYRHYASGEDAYVADAETGPYVLEGYVDTDYVDDTGDPRYWVEDYTTNADGGWVVIADGFSSEGSRWEAVNINGWAVFNNGYELPYTYRVEHNEAFPNYEMRDAGIARIGTITDFASMLIGCDVYQFKEGALADQMSHFYGGSFEIRQHGAMLSQPFTAQKSTSGFAIRGTGATGYVTVPNDATIQTYTDGLTVEAWVRVSNSADTTSIVQKGSTFLNGCFSLIIGSGVVTATVWQDGGGPIDTSTDWEFGLEWINIAMTYDPATGSLKLYVGGELASSFTGSPAAVNTNTGDLAIALTGGSHLLDVAEMRLWTKVRTAAELVENLSTPLATDADLVGYWKFDDGTGTTATDDSGNGNDGSVGVGSSWVSSAAPCDSYIEITPVAATSGGLTRVSTTATFVCSSPHKLTTGQLVQISGATETEYNGLFTVTVIDVLTFEYTVSGTPASPDGGSPEVRRALFGQSGFNYDGMVGKKLLLFNGYAGTITDVVDPVTIKVAKSTLVLTGESMFQVINETTSTALTGTLAKNGTTTVTGTGTAFESELWPGASILIPGGVTGDEIRIVAAIASDTSLTVTDAFASTASGQTGALMGDNLIISEDDYFTSEMEGRFIFFDDGHYRKILEFVDDRWCRVAETTAVMQQIFQLENNTAYNAVNDPSKVERVQYRRVWSDIDQPLRFAASTPASATAGSRVIQLQYQRKSLEAGDSILITGAGVAGGNLTANIVWIHPNHQTLYIDTAASETVGFEECFVSRSDAAGSVSGYDDLQDDSSAIIKAKELSGVLVVIKETSFYVTRYTGVAADPFANEQVCKEIQSRGLFYRNTLIRAGLKSLLYAGKDEFYEFNLVNREPVIFKGLVNSSDNFFDSATLANTNQIFSAENSLTQEIFFCFPASGSDAALVYDLKWGTQRTSSDRYTAMASIRRPNDAMTSTVQEDWVLMGDSSGRVQRYGLAENPQAEWGDRKAIYSRLGSGYESRLTSGLIGDRFFETEMSEWMAELASQDYPTVTQFTFNLYGWRNAPQRPPRTLVSKLITLPNITPHVPMCFLAHYFQDEIVVTGTNNPLRIIARTVALSRRGGRVQQKFGNY